MFDSPFCTSIRFLALINAACFYCITNFARSAFTKQPLICPKMKVLLARTSLPAADALTPPPTMHLRRLTARRQIPPRPRRKVSTLGRFWVHTNFPLFPEGEEKGKSAINFHSPLLIRLTYIIPPHAPYCTRLKKCCSCCPVEPHVIYHSLFFFFSAGYASSPAKSLDPYLADSKGDL